MTTQNNHSFASLLNTGIYTDHGQNHILGVGTVANVKDLTWHGEDHSHTIRPLVPVC